MTESDAKIINWRSAACESLRGAICVPGDKSISHRAIILGSLARGITSISGFLEGNDTLDTVAACAQLGVHIEKTGQGQRIIQGVGLHGLKKSDHPLDFGNSGTAMRLMAGVLAGQRFSSQLIGDESLSRRPMRRVIEPLQRMGARIHAASNDCAPLEIQPSLNGLSGIDYDVPVASAQVKSALLLAGLYARGVTCVRESRPTRDYTERMLHHMGAHIDAVGNEVRISKTEQLSAQAIDIPGDFSSAAFFIVAASIVPGSDVIIKNVGVHPRRTGLLNVMHDMGAKISLLNERLMGGEQVADIHVQYAPLQSVVVAENEVPDMIDEFPVLFVAAACAKGETLIRHASELRVKESDRIATMANVLRNLGVGVKELPDGAVITGGCFRGGQVNSCGDHRIAMASAIAGCVARSPVQIENCAHVATSFPGFIVLANQMGMQIQEDHMS